MAILDPNLRAFRAVLEGLDPGDLAALLDGLAEARETHARAGRKPAAALARPRQQTGLYVVPDAFCRPSPGGLTRADRLGARDRAIIEALQLTGASTRSAQAECLHAVWLDHASGMRAPPHLEEIVATIADFHGGRPLSAIQIFRISAGDRSPTCPP